MRHGEEKVEATLETSLDFHVVASPCGFDSEWGCSVFESDLSWLPVTTLSCNAATILMQLPEHSVCCPLSPQLFLLISCPPFALTFCITSSFLRCSLSQFLSFRLKDIVLEISSVNVVFLPLNEPMNHCMPGFHSSSLDCLCCVNIYFCTQCSCCMVSTLSEAQDPSFIFMHRLVPR